MNYRSDPGFWLQLGSALMASGAKSADPGAGQRALSQGLSNLSGYMTNQRQLQQQEEARRAAQAIQQRRMRLLEDAANREVTQRRAYEKAIGIMFPPIPPQPGVPGPDEAPDDSNIAGLPVTPERPNPQGAFLGALGPKIGGAALAEQMFRKPSARYISTPTGQVLDKYTGRLLGETGASRFAGTSMDAQSWNTIMHGDPASPMYAAAYAHLSKPRTYLDQSLGQVVTVPPADLSRFRRPSGAPITAGPTVSQVKPRKRTPEEAGRTTMITQAMEDTTFVKTAILGTPESPKKRDNTLLAQMYGNVPGTRGRRLRSRIENALASKLRLETGAQANPGEIANIRDRFMPSPLDDDDTIRDKLERLEAFMQQSLELTDPDLYQKLKGRVEGKSEASTATPSIPMKLRGIPNLQWSESRQQYRDPSTNTIYDKSGNMVNQ